jgi:hypothetical protein
MYALAKAAAALRPYASTPVEVFAKAEERPVRLLHRREVILKVVFEKELWPPGVARPLLLVQAVPQDGELE